MKSPVTGGSGHLFKRWFTMVDDCPRCGLHFEREQGYWAGALAINIGIAGVVFVLAFALPVAAKSAIRPGALFRRRSRSGCIHTGTSGISQVPW